MLKVLRNHRRSLGSGMMFLLLSAWLSVFCAHCFAAAEPVAESAPHCGSQPLPLDSLAHDCCDSGYAHTGAACGGLNCAEMAPVAAPETDYAGITPGDADFPELPQAPPSLDLAATPSADGCAIVTSSLPIFLRNCTFLM